MKSFIHLFIFSFFITAMIACQEDDLQVFNPENKSVENIEFTYKNIVYHSDCYYNVDSVLIFENNEVGNVYNKIIENPSLATLITPTGHTIYFDSYDKQQEYLSELIPSLADYSEKTTRASETGRCFLSLYEHENYNGRLQQFNTTADLNIDDLRVYDFENKMTSFKLMSGNGHYSVTFFRNLYYEGATITFWTNPLYVCEESNVGKFNCSSHKTWNDQLSCFKLTKW